MLPSMELATEDHSGLIGSCDRDYGCIYMNTLSWRTPTTPLPMEINPRKVFERMFGAGGSASRASGAHPGGSQHPRRHPHGGIQRSSCSSAPSDRQTMDQYLENLREIERRIQRAEKSQGDEDLQLPERPSGVPFDYEEHIKLMYDLMALAYQANITRVATFMVSREVSNRTYPQVGVTDGHHAISHHQNRAESMEKNVRIQTYNVGHVQVLPRPAEEHAGRRRHAARQLADPLRQQHEQQQRARSLPAAERGGGRRGRQDEGRTAIFATRITRRWRTC